MSLDVAAATRGSGRELFRSLRPRQWIKNLLVFAAPVAGGKLAHGTVIAGAVLAFAVFTAAAAGGYLLNDVNDMRRDQIHPDKRYRPVAAGTLSPSVATRAGILLTLTAVIVAEAADEELLALLVGLYSALTLAYGFGGKRIPGVELLLVSSGFVLRPLAGSAATGVHPSAWFLAVCCLAALALATGKRQVELVGLGRFAAAHRSTLRHYTLRGLRTLQALSIVGMLITYGGWALSRDPTQQRLIAMVSLVPVVVAFARVSVLNNRGEGGAPELLLLQDRWIQVAALTWVALFVGGIGRV